MPLYGRTRSWNLVRKCMESRPSPILVITGTRYSGKTAMLDAIAERLRRRRVHHAKIDFAGAEPMALHAALDALVLEFWRNGGAYRPLRFHRYLLARMVMGTDFGTTDPVLIRSRIREIVRRHWTGAEVTELAADLGGAAVEAFGTGIHAGAARDVIRIVIGRLSRLLRLGWRPGAKWFGGRGPSPEDVLTTLHLSARLGPDDGAAYVDSLLMDAFTADVRADHKKGRCAVNYVVLLDNVDDAADTGQPVVARLADIMGATTPLTVVATSREPSADAVGPVAERTADEELAAFTPGRTPQWLSVRLPDLTEAEVHAMVRDAGPAAVDARAAGRDLYAFTEGHAGAGADLLEAVGEHRVADLRRLLAERPAGGASVLTRVLEHLLGDLLAFPSLEADMTVCAAARDQEEAVALAAGRGLGAVRITAVIRPELWVPGPEKPQRVIPPALRRLLLERLRERDPGRADGWNTVFGQLHDIAAARGDLAGMLHHDLAKGNHAAVVRRLSELLADDPARAGMPTSEWLDLLAQVTAAPNRLETGPGERATSQMVLESVKDADDRVRNVAVLVGARWISGDPLARGRAAARQEIGAALGAVALAYPHRFEALNAAARAHGHDARVAPPEATPHEDDLPRPFPLRVAALATTLGVVVALLGGLGWWYANYCGTPLDGFAYPRVSAGASSECVGVTDSLAFRPEYAPVMKALKAENDFATKGGPGTYATVALAGPLTDTEPRTLHEIEGAVAGIHDANRAHLTGSWPPIRLVLANMDSHEGHWKTTTDRLVGMRGGPDHLMAVAGVGLSQTETVEEVQELGRAGVPVIGDMFTAHTYDLRNLPGMFRVNPTTADQLDALRQYFGGRLRGHKAMLVVYNKQGDLYSSATASAFTADLGGPWKAGGKLIAPFHGDHPDDDFRLITANLCSVENLDTIYYAGRAKDLPSFIGNLANRIGCHKGAITVITTSDTTRLVAPTTVNKAAWKGLENPDNPVRLIYTPLAEPSVLERGPSKVAFDAFRTTFTKLHFDAAHLDTGWAITEHDAVLTASRAIRIAERGKSALVDARAVGTTLPLMSSRTNGLRGASGVIRLDPKTGDRNCADFRIPVLRFTPGRAPDVLHTYAACGNR